MRTCGHAEIRGVVASIETPCTATYSQTYLSDYWKLEILFKCHTAPNQPHNFITIYEPLQIKLVINQCTLSRSEFHTTSPYIFLTPRSIDFDMSINTTFLHKISESTYKPPCHALLISYQVIPKNKNDIDYTQLPHRKKEDSGLYRS